ncbi:MAG: hypothetical protein WA682_06560 [Acidobacteriaceae bacterium]
MNAKRNLSQLAAALVAIGSLASLSNVALAEDENAKYTLASLCGDYGAVVTYGANVAAGFGHEKYDGHGNATGAALANQPGPGGTRTITSFGISGTYIVNKDGSGLRYLTIALPGGGTAHVTEDFVITRSEVVGGIAIATEIADAQREPSAVIDDQSLVRHTLTLRGKPGAGSQAGTCGN